MKKIERKKLVTKHNPILQKCEFDSPLSVGNGDFCFSCDITGFQSFYDSYAKHNFPLCTMSTFGWHTEPYSTKTYAPNRNELILTEYDSLRGKEKYAVEKFPGNETIYDWFRENPHRLNLVKIALIDETENLIGDTLCFEKLSQTKQELHVYDGYIESSFVYNTIRYTVITVCDSKSHTLSFSVEISGETNQAISKEKLLSIELGFPYGSSKKEASEWNRLSQHKTKTEYIDSILQVQRTLEKDSFSFSLSGENIVFQTFDSEHRVLVRPSFKNSSSLSSSVSASLSFSFSCTYNPAQEMQLDKAVSFENLRNNAKEFWNSFWEKGGFIDFSKSTDSRSFELERRIILSQYLLRIQSASSMPPAETGLSCNSWYGKFHLEMYPFHTAWLAVWEHEEVLEKSLLWFLDHLEHAKENAKKNGFRGARWPKMIGPDAIDSPSPIATLLIWQQAHILYSLELLYTNFQKKNTSTKKANATDKAKTLLEQYKTCVFETAEFMADFASLDSNTNTWNLVAPLIPVQEEFDPRNVKNPAFELEYWSFGLGIAIRWFERLGESYPKRWKEIAKHMAKMPTHDGLYIAHENCVDTFVSFNKDHPSMLMSLGFLPQSELKRIDKNTMKNTLHKVIESWEYESLWGWDFAMMALTAARLGEKELAIDLLLTESSKNCYTISGHNKQSSRKDLPVYLPGNGSLLLAVAHLTASGAFSKGKWNVVYENIQSIFND